MRRSGFTMAELLLVVTLIGVLAGLAAPRLSEYNARQRRVAALNRFAGDLYRARMEALRRGNRVELRLSNSGRCAVPPRGSAGDGWSIVPLRGGEPLRTVQPGDLGAGVCLATNGDAALEITSRGLLAPFENRTVWVRHGSRADTLVVSVLGRVLRRY